MPEATEKATRVGILALITPVMTLTLGRWVAKTKWMPTARAIWAKRTMPISISLAATTIKSANSSITKTM